jgi:site-specific DNA-cytosine methylase
MNVLSTFDGISGAQVALYRADISVSDYFSSEIDKYAIAVTQHHFPSTIQLGDIEKWRDWNLPHIDLLIGGSPCQGFSHAGAGLNFDDPRSRLFFDYVTIKNELNPTYFLLENVKMKKEWRDTITKYMGVEPILINSALVSAQNRQRYYWTNIPGVVQPEDKGIYLKNVIEDADLDPMILHNIYGGFGETEPRVFTSKSPTIRTASGGGHIPSVWVDRDKSKSVRVGVRESPIGSKQEWDIVGIRQNFKLLNRYGKEKPSNKKGGCLTGGAHSGGNHSDMDIICLGDPDKIQYTHSGRIILHDNESIRRLTPLECERLQTYPDGYTDVGISNTQRYKSLGNSFTVDVIAHILSFIPNKG